MDHRLLIAIRLVRAFAFGFSAVLIGVHLERRGLSPTAIGLVLTISLAASAAVSLGFAAASNRWGRRATLGATGILMTITGLDLAFSTNIWLLLISGITGMLGVAGTDSGPFSAVEQAILTQAVPPHRRNIAFARYSLSGGVASALGGLGGTFATDASVSAAFFELYAVLGLVVAVVPLFMSSSVESTQLTAPAFGAKRPLLGLYALFALDSFAGGVILPSVIAYWLHVRFNAGTEIVGPAFAAMVIVQALSYEASGRLANRFGLVNTMVFTHLPSNVLTILVPFAPTFQWAVALLLLRATISQMDVPARQAYLVSIVSPSERAGVLALSGAVRGAAQAVGPVLAGLAIQASGVFIGFPFVLGGGLKVVYDLGLFRGFRHRLAEHETPVRKP